MDLRELQKTYLDNLRKVTEDKLEIGSLVRTVISIEEGLVFKDGRKQKPKKLVIIGVDKVKKVCYGSVLVNTKMSPKAAYSDSFLSAQYLLHQTDYPEFLKYDSFVDCGMLFSIPLKKLMEGEYFGTLTSQDLQGIFEVLKTTETLTNKEEIWNFIKYSSPFEWRQVQSDTAMRNKIKLNTIVFRTTQKICVISEIRVPLIPPDRTGLRNLCLSVQSVGLKKNKLLIRATTSAERYCNEEQIW